MEKHHDMTDKELASVIYGAWAGNPEGVHYSPTYCATQVWSTDNWRSYQCTRKPGHGPKQLYCKQHAKRYESVSAEAEATMTKKEK